MKQCGIENAQIRHVMFAFEVGFPPQFVWHRQSGIVSRIDWVNWSKFLVKLHPSFEHGLLVENVVLLPNFLHCVRCTRVSNPFIGEVNEAITKDTRQCPESIQQLIIHFETSGRNQAARTLNWLFIVTSHVQFSKQKYWFPSFCYPKCSQN
jgi:hypothetical protein